MSKLLRHSLRSATAVLTMAAAAALSAPAALADSGEDASEDPRAVVHEGNVSSCEQLDIAGTLLDKGDLTFSGGVHEQDQYLTIESVPDGITVTAIVVKGGPNHNLYVPGKHGLDTESSWAELRSPVNPGGNIPQISHWFACGKTTPDTTTPDATTTQPDGGDKTTTPVETTPATTTTSATTTTAPTGTTTATRSASEKPSGQATSTTYVAPVADASGPGALADTGFSGGWLLWVGGALVLAGAAVLVLLGLRRRNG